MSVDLLSDTVYRDQAMAIVQEFVRQHGTPVKRSQIHGLRQISLQEPLSVKSFADHQRQRVEKKLETTRGPTASRLEAEKEFWKLVSDLSSATSASWSVVQEAEHYAPEYLREQNIPSKAPSATPEERQQRNRLLAERKTWMERWLETHIPAFFQRFCTEYLYYLALEENHKSAQQS
ncbi:MAG: hypothetical protein KatS3mg110_0252 [Pirellulaceae bacterium]|nr:MAG: hypothetical protein KatS3mg110_0252 [Pirellulaceae bacterium]